MGLRYVPVQAPRGVQTDERGQCPGYHGERREHDRDAHRRQGRRYQDGQSGRHREQLAEVRHALVPDLAFRIPNRSKGGRRSGKGESSGKLNEHGEMAGRLHAPGGPYHRHLLGRGESPVLRRRKQRQSTLGLRVQREHPVDAQEARHHLPELDADHLPRVVELGVHGTDGLRGRVSVADEAGEARRGHAALGEVRDRAPQLACGLAVAHKVPEAVPADFNDRRPDGELG